MWQIPAFGADFGMVGGWCWKKPSQVGFVKFGALFIRTLFQIGLTLLCLALARAQLRERIRLMMCAVRYPLSS